MPTTASRPSLNLGFVFKGALLFLFIAYLSIAGAKFAGLVLFQLFQAGVIFVIGVGLAWAAWRLISRRAFPATPIDLGVYLWLAALCLATLFSQDPRRSLETLAVNVVYVFGFYLLVDLIRAGWDGQQMIAFLIVCSLFYLGFGYSEVFTWYSKWIAISGWQHPFPPIAMRVQASIGHPNILAAYLNLLIPLGLVRILGARRGWVKAALALWTLLALGLVYFTSSRGGWVATAAIFATLLVLLALDRRAAVRRAWDWLKRRVLVIAALAASVLLAAGGLSFLLLRQLNNPTHPGLCDPSSARSYIWAVALAEFRRSPLIGVGPGTFVRDFLVSFSIPPSALLPHAHNYLLGMLGEAGLVGFLSTLLLTFLIARVFYRRWRQTPPGQRLLLSGSIAALVGLAVHSLVDIPQAMPLVNLISALLIAIELPPPGPRRSWHRLANAVMLALALVSGGVLAFFLRGYQYFNAGLQETAMNRWEAAAQQMESAARFDPGMAYYWLQAGFARGMVALNADGTLRDRAQIEQAILDYRRGQSIFAGYALDWANLGRLELAAGDIPAGMTALRRAVALAPDSDQLNLALAEAEEKQGLDQAGLDYLKALQLQPAWHTSEFFQQSAVRRAALAAYDEWLAHQSSVDDPSGCLIQQTPNSLYAQQGSALLAQNRLDEARQALQKSDFIAGGTVDTSIDLGLFYQYAGQPDQALDAYRTAYYLLRQTSVYGPGTFANQDGWILYLREGPQPDLLPGFNHFLLTPHISNALEALAGLYQQKGEDRSAADVRRFIAQSLPVP